MHNHYNDRLNNCENYPARVPCTRLPFVLRTIWEKRAWDYSISKLSNCEKCETVISIIKRGAKGPASWWYLVCLIMIVICCLSEKPTVLAKNQDLYDNFQSILRQNQAYALISVLRDWFSVKFKSAAFIHRWTLWMFKIFISDLTFIPALNLKSRLCSCMVNLYKCLEKHPRLVWGACNVG